MRRGCSIVLGKGVEQRIPPGVLGPAEVSSNLSTPGGCRPGTLEPSGFSIVFVFNAHSAGLNHEQVRKVELWKFLVSEPHC